MSFTVVIPARYASTRLPGKPLLDIAGWPMIRHVYDRALGSGAGAVYIATDDERVAGAASRFTDHVVMTGAAHESGTDRVEEVSRLIGLDDGEIVVNVQGDEPLIDPRLIDQVAADLASHPDAGISSLYEPLARGESADDADLVKVVTDEQGYALYFSRSAIPWQRRDTDTAAVCQRHIGIYAYRVSTLRRFVQWPPAMLEKAERLEQLRALANGVRIHMSAACVPSAGGVDTEADLQRVRARLGTPDRFHHAGENSNMSHDKPLRVLMVCLGNICRSPTAHAVMLRHLEEAGLAGAVEVDSAGTGDYHIGKPPDSRAREAAQGRGYDLSALRARQLTADDFEAFDYLLAMDLSNLEHMHHMAPESARDKVHLMLSPLGGEREVPDPYFGGDEGFDEVLDLVESACNRWLQEFRRKLEPQR